jgi:hypothetical protein
VGNAWPVPEPGVPGGPIPGGPLVQSRSGGALGCGIHFVPGVTAGGPTSGGLMSGALMSGGATSGGLMSGGPMSVGTAAGGLMSGGLMSGALMSGGAMSGGLTAHGSPGGSAGEGVRKTIVSPLVPASTGAPQKSQKVDEGSIALLQLEQVIRLFPLMVLSNLSIMLLKKLGVYPI